MSLIRLPHLPHLPHRGRAVAAVAGLLTATTMTLGSSPATAATPVPPTPAGLPSTIEPLATYVAANSCDPHAKPGTTAVANLLVRTYGSRYGIDRTCGTDPLPTSEHYDGRAVDYFQSVRVPAQKAKIDAFVQWLFATDAQGNRFANARRLGVMYLIWDGRIWGSYRATDGWRPYSSCASHPGTGYDTTCHRDHLHVSLSWAGAMGRTSYWTTQVAGTDYGPCRESSLNWAAPYTGMRPTPCPAYPRVYPAAGASALTRTLTTYSGMVLRHGDTGPVVRAVQQAVGTSADGSFGPMTQAAVTTWQRAHGVPATGAVDAATWHALLGSAPSTSAPTAPAPVRTVSHPELTRYRALVLRVGSRGPAVAAVQRRLGMSPARGNFGSRTKARVRTFQARHGVPVSGVVGARTWTALGA